MTKIIIPVTPNDFSTLERIISKNNDKFCPYCDGELTTKERFPFSEGIFYDCKQCGKNFRKTNFRGTSDGDDYFELIKTREI